MHKQEDIYAYIDTNVKVDRPQIVAAKEYLISQYRKNKSNSGKSMLVNFLDSVDAKQPEKVIANELVDSTTSIQKAIKNISWTLAFSEAIWALIHSNYLLTMDGSVTSDEPNIPWTTINERGSGFSGGWSFVNWKYSLPNQVVIAPSFSFCDQDYLVEPDLFLKHMNIESMQEGVKEALQDAILCFRAELYTPCLAMITKAMEGTWAELGLALISTLDDTKKQQLNNYYVVFSDEFSSISKIVRYALELYEKQDIFSTVKKQSNVKLEDLRNAVVWADCVRESRNSLHFGNDPMFPNNFEKVATLLLGVPTHFKVLYTLIDTCNHMGST